MQGAPNASCRRARCGWRPRAPRLAAPARRPSSTARCPCPSCSAVDQRRARERPLVRRALGLEDPVGDLAARAGERLLQLRLVVDVASSARSRSAPGKRSTIAGSIGSKPCSRKSAASAASSSAASTLRLSASRSSSSAAASWPRSTSRAPRPSSCATTAQLCAGDDVRADLREPPFGEVRVARRRAPARPRARGRCRRGTRAARTRAPGRPPTTSA